MLTAQQSLDILPWIIVCIDCVHGLHLTSKSRCMRGSAIQLSLAEVLFSNSKHCPCCLPGVVCCAGEDPDSPGWRG